MTGVLDMSYILDQFVQNSKLPTFLTPQTYWLNLTIDSQPLVPTVLTGAT